MCGQESREPWETHKFRFFGGWAEGRGVYWPRKRSSWIGNALENFAARPSPSLWEIRKAASISSFEHESEKKGPRSLRPRQRSRPRFSDLSFHQQPCYRVRCISSVVIVNLSAAGSKPYLNIFRIAPPSMGQIRYKGHWKGWALKIKTFLDPEMATSDVFGSNGICVARCNFRAQKSLDF
jgi:hypothetical protein